MLKKLSKKCKTLGCIKGESAADFRARNPKAATDLAQFIADNKTELTSAIAGILSQIAKK